MLIWMNVYIYDTHYKKPGTLNSYSFVALMIRGPTKVVVYQQRMHLLGIRLDLENVSQSPWDGSDLQ